MLLHSLLCLAVFVPFPPHRISTRTSRLYTTCYTSTRMSALIRTLPRVSSGLLASQMRLQLRLQLRGYASYPAHSLIGMPALSPTMTQGNLAVWAKKEGDALAPGDVIAEVETDKAQMDFEFQEDGYLAKILVPEGTKDIPVNKPIAVYVEEQEDVAAFKDFTLEDSQSSVNAKASEENTTTTKNDQSIKDISEQEPKDTSATSTSASDHASSRIIASPLAKMIALEKGVPLRDIKGTGPHGRIVKIDIEKYLSSLEKEPKSVQSGATTTTSTSSTAQRDAGRVTPAAASMPIPPASSASYEDIEITQMRRIIADRLLESRQSIPSYIISSNISMNKLIKLRKSLNGSSNGQYKLSINDILIKAICIAAKRVPEANSHWLPREGVIRKYNNVDVSVAVATPTGLLTPIVKNADTKGLTSISAEVKELAKRAKSNKLMPEEFQGGTICISNLGMNPAVSMFTSIINPPQSTILAVGTIQRVAVEDAGAENGFTFDEQVNITGTFDHRTIDGAKGGEFMRELKQIIENPLELLL